MSPWNVLRAEAFFRGYGLKIVAGIRYFGGFVGTNVVQDFWLGEKVDVWRALGTTLAGVARRHLQTAYAGLQKSLQQEWAFVKCATPDIGMDFQVVEDTLWDILLPDLFKGAIEQIPGRAITSLPVKQSGISLPDPTRTAGANWMAYL